MLTLKRRSLLALPAGRRGFTLVELLLVLMILATLAAIIIPKFSGRTQQAKITAAKTQIQSIKTALDAFEVDLGSYPTTSDGLDCLVAEPRNSRGNWRGPYLDKIPTDPWGNPYIYEYPGRHNEKSFDITSAGEDGQRDTQDDISNWNLEQK